MESYFVELTGVGRSHLNHEDVEEDNITDHEAIIKMEYSLISAGTELSRAYGLKKGIKYPIKPGYSSVGRIIAKGEKLDIDIGDKVFVNCHHTSLTKWANCDEVQYPMILKVDEDIDSKHATIINLGLVALQGVNLCDVKLGYTVGIFGLGNIGILTGLMFKKLGCKVVGIDPISNRCDLASQLGFEYVIDKEKPKPIIDRLLDNQGFDIVVDVTGVSKLIVELADYTKNYGQLLLLGSPRESYETDVTDFLSKIHMKNIKVIGGFNNTIPVNPIPGSNNNMKRNLKVVCDLIKNKYIDVEKMISYVIDPKDCQKAYEDLMYNKDKVNCVIFDWSNY